jgi:hypothetical protein
MVWRIKTKSNQKTAAEKSSAFILLAYRLTINPTHSSISKLKSFQLPSTFFDVDLVPSCRSVNTYFDLFFGFTFHLCFIGKKQSLVVVYSIIFLEEYAAETLITTK